MRVRLLGPLHVGSGSMRLGPRDRVVLSALAVHPGDSLSAEAIADALWQEHPPASWAKVVQGCISRLRSALGPDVITTESNGYRLEPRGIETDRDEFEEIVATGREHLAVGSPERAASAFTQALALWRGRPFDELEEWMPGRLEANRLNELRLTVQEDLLQARLDAGQHREVAAEGTVLVGEEPWRERRWELLSLAQYRCGRQADALGSIRAARRALGQELGLDPSSGLVALEQAILSQDASLAADHEARAASDQCPWMGLASYDPENTDTFFGRAEDVTACLDKLDRSPLLALVGPSGSGKSSLMKAGLVPALRARGEDVVTLTPGADPAGSLAEARASSPRGTVLCIDQFEEVFTGGQDRRSVIGWLREIGEYAGTRGKVVVTVRSDYVADLSADPTFAGLVERGLHLVAPLEGEALREIIEGPARIAGLRLEHGLVDLLLRDAAGQPGALPLLSHALAETWRRREDALLTVDDYQASGGISGAVAASADRLCDSLTETGRGQLRWLMLRMGSLAEHGEPVRTAVPRQVVADHPERARVIDLLVRARLVTSVDGSYELAHESLVKAWPQLRAWLEEDRDGQRLWRHLASAATEWDALGRPDSELYQGIRLETAFEWASRAGSQPTRLEREFLDASTAHADAERLALAMQARTERRQNRRLRGLLAGVVAMLVLALVATALAADQQQTAAHQRDSARDARSLAQHESLVARSLSLRTTKRAIAALLAVEAHRSRPGALSQSALMGTFTEASGFMGYTEVPYDVVQGAAVPGTRQAVMASGTRIHLVDLDSGELGPLFDHPMSSDKSLISVIRVSGNGRRVAQLMFDPDAINTCGNYDRLEDDDGQGCTVLTVFDLETRRPIFGPVSTPVQGGDMDIDATGRVVAVAGGFDGDLVTYDVDRRRMLGRIAGYPRPEGAENVRDTAAVEFDGRGGVWFASMSGPVRLVDPRSLAVRRTLPLPTKAANNFLTVTPVGVLVGAGDEQIVSIDTRTGQRLWTVDLTDSAEAWPCFSLAVADELGRFYCGSQFGEIDERDLASGQLTGVRLDSQRGETGDLSVAAGGELLEFGRGYYLRWRLDGSGPIARLVAPGALSRAGYDPSGRYLAVHPRDVQGPDYGPHTILGVAAGTPALRLDVRGVPVWIDSHTMRVRGEGDGVLVDVATGRSRIPASDEVAVADEVFAGVDGEHAWASVFREPFGSPASEAPEEVYDVIEFESGTGRLTGRRFEMPGYPYSMFPSSDGNRVWVGYYRPGGSWLAYEDETNRRGTFVALAPVEHGEEMLVSSSTYEDGSGNERLVGSDHTGEIREYDPDTLEPMATLPGSRGFVWNLRFSDDGTRLFASGVDGGLNIYDTRSWIRVATIPSETGAQGAPEGWMRPDGKAVAVNGRLGVAEWTLEPARLATAACTLAGRNLTRAEWATYLGDEPYRRTCPEYPAGE